VYVFGYLWPFSIGCLTNKFLVSSVLASYSRKKCVPGGLQSENRGYSGDSKRLNSSAESPPTPHADWRNAVNHGPWNWCARSDRPHGRPGWQQLRFHLPRVGRLPRDWFRDDARPCNLEDYPWLTCLVLESFQTAQKQKLV